MIEIGLTQGQNLFEFDNLGFKYLLCCQIDSIQFSFSLIPENDKILVTSNLILKNVNVEPLGNYFC